MFQVNDTIMYGTQGICKIVEITQKDFLGTKKEYYVLKPMSDSGATLFAPVNNEKQMENIFICRMSVSLKKQKEFCMMNSNMY